MHDSSNQSSIDSQYEEVANRPNRSFSDASFDEDDSADGLYSCVGAPSGIKLAGQPAQGPGELYSLVGAGASTLPRAATGGGDVMYELVGTRPSRSKSAPPTYDMVQAAKKSSPSKTIIEETAQESAESEDGRGFYDMVQQPGVDRQTSPKISDDVSLTEEQVTRSPQMGEDEKQKPASDVPVIYSLPQIHRKQKPSPRGLSVVSESGDAGDEPELAPVPTPEEKAPPLPPKVEESFAIDEIKRFLDETKINEAENERNHEQTNGKDTEDGVFPDKTVSAFQQLKEFLQRLDSTEAE